MTLVRNRPMSTRSFEGDLVGSFDRLFDQLARPTLGVADVGPTPLDLYETDDALILEMPVPGVRPEDLDLSLEGRRLTLRATVPDTQAEDRRYWLQSIPRGEISRSIKLPVAVAADDIEARVQDGLLVLTMPKAQEAKVKKIAIAQD